MEQSVPKPVLCTTQTAQPTMRHHHAEVHPAQRVSTQWALNTCVQAVTSQGHTGTTDSVLEIALQGLVSFNSGVGTGEGQDLHSLPRLPEGQ